MALALACAVLSCASLFHPSEGERFTPRLAPETTLELQAHWEPCRASRYKLFATTPLLRELQPEVERRLYSAAEFLPLLPTDAVALGAAWKVPDEAVLTFLRQFHPGATMSGTEEQGQAPGTHALLRAVGPDAYEILLRAHATFTLEGRVIYRPAQFEGRLVLARADGALRSFSLALPSRNPNVDVNVPLELEQQSARTLIADLGWVPRMELASVGAGEPPTWTEEVPDEQARLTLRRAFYPFATLDWLPFEKAVQAAREQRKCLHLVVLFGCLDDDSC